MVGLGKAALDKGYKRVMVIADDYAFPYSQVQGFMTEYCRLGGKVPVKAWVPLGGKDYSSVIARIPKDVDALVVVLGGVGQLAGTVVAALGLGVLGFVIIIAAVIDKNVKRPTGASRPGQGRGNV